MPVLQSKLSKLFRRVGIRDPSQPARKKPNNATLRRAQAPAAATTPTAQQPDDAAMLESAPAVTPPVGAPPLVGLLMETFFHFSKTSAPRLTFQNDTRSYQQWAALFKTEMSIYNNLDSCLEHEGELSSVVEQQRQNTAFHMIRICVPSVVQMALTTLPSAQQTGFVAWRTLRQHYLGDEATYLQALETRFNNIHWMDEEEFPAFEIRFDTIASELENAGQPKPDHVKKAVVMRAVFTSNKKDAHGVQVHGRLNMIAKIHEARPFKEWIGCIRLEAQQIREEIRLAALTRGSTKRSHQEADTAIPVSYAAPTHSSAQRKFVSVQRRGGLCRSMQRYGTCRFGTACKFSHDVGKARVGESAAVPSSAPTTTREVCRNFLAGRCWRGAACRFEHASSSPGGSSNQSGNSDGQKFSLARVDASQPASASLPFHIDTVGDFGVESDAQYNHVKQQY